MYVDAFYCPRSTAFIEIRVGNISAYVGLVVLKLL